MKKLTAIILVSVFTLIMFAPLTALADGSLYLPNPIKCNNLMCVLIDLIRLLLGAVGVFGVTAFIVGGFWMILSGGNQELIKKGKDTLLYSTIGIVVVIISWIIIRTIIDVTSSGTI